LDIYYDLGLSENLGGTPQKLLVYHHIPHQIAILWVPHGATHPHELHQDIHAWANMGMIWHDMDGP
jgi:hypothetical protein